MAVSPEVREGAGGVPARPEFPYPNTPPGSVAAAGSPTAGCVVTAGSTGASTIARLVVVAGAVVVLVGVGW